LVANGLFREALELIKEKIPLPASIGRVCPHPCEEACRRKLVEEPVSILNIKRIAADADLASASPYLPQAEPDTGKSVAVVGGGPGGLSAAYFLKCMGHSVVVIDAMEKMGGMLRYGIPEYRLPKKVLDEEIRLIEKMGIAFANGVKVGKDVSLDSIRRRHDAVVISIGAWKSAALGCPGESLEGVVGGIDFLRDAALNDLSSVGRAVAVVGGGNTAMDACRTAVRLGAEKVYVIYRRTRAEMPAEKSEISEAVEEGVEFKFLVSPIEIIGEGGSASKIRLQRMELGSPDASGRRKPVPIEGSEELLEVDMVIAAIGQTVDLAGFDEISVNRGGAIAADESVFLTSAEGVFAIGDASNKGPGIAIEAIADARMAADAIDSFLACGKPAPAKKIFSVTEEKTSADFVSQPKAAREKAKIISPKARRRSFAEASLGLDARQAVKEAKRCLECGCADYFECKLVKLARDYDATGEMYKGAKHKGGVDKSSPFFHRNSNKCIMCGLCVRICDEAMGRTALGLAGRGFDTEAVPELGLPLASSDCISCGQCVSACPTGALVEVLPIDKPAPWVEEERLSVCSFCSVGCEIRMRCKGPLITRMLPEDGGTLCAKGRFGFFQLNRSSRLTRPLMRKDGALYPADWQDAFVQIAKRMQGIRSVWGPEAIGVSVSGKLCVEEISLAKRYAREVLKTDNVFSIGESASGLSDVLGSDSSTAAFEEMMRAEAVICACRDIVNANGVAAGYLKKASENGAKIIIISPEKTQADEWARIKLEPDNSLKILKGLASELMNESLAGATGLKSALSGVLSSPEVKEAAEIYAQAKTAVIIFNQSELSVDAARLLGDIAVLGGKASGARCGVIQLKPNVNSQGLADLGVSTDGKAYAKQIESGKMKGLVIFGEDAAHVDFSKLEFLAVSDLILTETAEKADIVLPAASLFEGDGFCVNAEGKLKRASAKLPSPAPKTNPQMIREMCEAAGAGLKPSMERGFSRGAEPEARLVAPEGDEMYCFTENTDAMHRAFARFMEREGLLRK
jgi:formate dehydrogenase major subunit